jgi:hypothetical protein
MPRFNRVYRFLAGEAGKKGIEIAQPMRIGFDLYKNLDEDANAYTFKIYNLAPQIRKDIEKPDSRCEFHAGYAEEDGPVLAAVGATMRASTSTESQDVVTTLTVRDGGIQIRDTAVSLGYGPGSCASAIIQDIAKQMKLPLVMAGDLPDRNWEHGFSFYGAAWEALHKITQGAGLIWSVQNQQLQVIPRMGATKRQAMVLSAGFGLTGSPRQERTAAQGIAIAKDRPPGNKVKVVSARQQSDGLTVTSLLLPQINPGDRVKFEAESMPGFFRVQSVRHTGDNYGDNWHSELKLIKLNAPDKKEGGNG